MGYGCGDFRRSILLVDLRNTSLVTKCLELMCNCCNEPKLTKKERRILEQAKRIAKQMSRNNGSGSN
jgi:hypothetical protein